MQSWMLGFTRKAAERLGLSGVGEDAVMLNLMSSRYESLMLQRKIIAP